MATRPEAPSRHVIAPDQNGHYALYFDTSDGLVYLDTFATLEQAKMVSGPVNTVVVPMLWDAPIIDPADPSSNADHPDAYPGRYSDDHWSTW